MHPRSTSRFRANDIDPPWPTDQTKNVKLLLDFVRKRGAVHPREVDEHFSHGRVTNYWGGSSNATTHLLDAMHYSGLLRIVRREKGIRIYAAHKHEAVPRGAAERRARVDALVDVLVRIYAPLPGPSLTYYLRRLRYAAPQWQKELPEALNRAKERLAHERVGKFDWYWPADENVKDVATPEVVRLLAPFDPVVHDRGRFELFWNWAYRFEAYTPVSKRKLGYYAMPLLWREHVIGWANLSIKNGVLDCDLGYINSNPPGDCSYKRALDEEVERMKLFLRL